ncbi:MAG: hypothetical protein FJ202_02645 [Gemmatimonadetes bacterium]|nr:hypothetical protein [Gemmatimonadota bacterium]
MIGRSIVAAAALALVGVGLATPAQSQEQPRSQECDLLMSGVRVAGEYTSRFTSFALASGRRNDFAGGGVDARCTNSDQRILADSAENFGDQRTVYLIGKVRYSEGRLTLNADRITYLMGEEKLIAEGNVNGRTSGGTRFSGPRAVYLRAKAGLRAQSRLDAGGRPDMWISAEDAGTSSGPADSAHVLADTVISINDSVVFARGKVVLERPDLVATGDSAMLDNGAEHAAMRRDPRIEGRGDRKFTLIGTEIDIYSRNREAERVRSAGSAKATSDDITLTADTLDLRLVDRDLDRAIAWGKGGARAAQGSREITADSIDTRLPGQRLRDLTAVRRARIESPADSTDIRSKERDWVTADTIVAHFDSVRAPGDTANRPRLTRLVASGSARSWQQAIRAGVAPPDSTPAINYMAGRVIDVTFDGDGGLDRVRVVDQVTGVLVQPAADSTKKAAPTVRKPPGGVMSSPAGSPRGSRRDD